MVLKKMWFIIILLLFTPVSPAEVKKDELSISLFRQKTPREVGMNIRDIKGFSTDWLKPKQNLYGIPENDSVAIYKYLDSEFYAVIQIGKKARPFNLVMDTAWGHTWVISDECPYTNVGCWFHNRYDHDKSSTYVENGTEISFNLGTYNVSGFFSEDVFHFGHLNVTNQTFIEMTNIPYFYILSKADGVLGLGYSSLANGVTPIFYNLYKQKRIKRAIFSVFLNRDRSSYKAGDVLLGSIDKTHILKGHNITYLPVNQTGYWQFKMDRIELDDYKKTIPFCLFGCQAISDTSTNSIMGPKLAIKKINRHIKAKYVAYGLYEIACETINKLPEITFVIGGKSFTLHGRDYVQKLSYKMVTICVSAFVTSEKYNLDTWVLGGAFLSEFYSIYDLENNQIGFVKAA